MVEAQWELGFRHAVQYRKLFGIQHQKYIARISVVFLNQLESLCAATKIRVGHIIR